MNITGNIITFKSENEFADYIKDGHTLRLVNDKYESTVFYDESEERPFMCIYLDAPGSTREWREPMEGLWAFWDRAWVEVEKNES